MASSGELGRQALPRRPLDYGSDESPSSLGPTPEPVTSPGRLSRPSHAAAGDASPSRLEVGDALRAERELTRADLWIAVVASAAVAVVVSELLHAAGLFLR
jgi:hypothetical protein